MTTRPHGFDSPEQYAAVEAGAGVRPYAAPQTDAPARLERRALAVEVRARHPDVEWTRDDGQTGQLRREVARTTWTCGGLRWALHVERDRLDDEGAGEGRETVSLLATPTGTTRCALLYYGDGREGSWPDQVDEALDVLAAAATGADGFGAALTPMPAPVRSADPVSDCEAGCGARMLESLMQTRADGALVCPPCLHAAEQARTEPDPPETLDDALVPGPVGRLRHAGPWPARTHCLACDAETRALYEQPNGRLLCRDCATPPAGDWYCPECDEYLSAGQVSYEETHNNGCGAEVEWCPLSEALTEQRECAGPCGEVLPTEMLSPSGYCGQCWPFEPKGASALPSVADVDAMHAAKDEADAHRAYRDAMEGRR